MLTERQQAFCKAYAESRDVTAAAVAAGYSEKSARSIGMKLLKQPEIQEALKAAPAGAAAPLAPAAPPPVPGPTVTPLARPAAAGTARPRAAPVATRATPSSPAPSPFSMPLIRPQPQATPVSGTQRASDALRSAASRTGEIASKARTQIGPVSARVAQGLSTAGARVVQGSRAASRTVAGLIGSKPKKAANDSFSASLSGDVEATGSRFGQGFRSTAKVLLGSDNEIRDYGPLLKLLLADCLALFGFFVLWYFGLVQAMLATDATRISLVILGIFLLTAAHCFYQTVVVSRELIAARKGEAAIIASGDRGLTILDDRVLTANGEELPPGIMTRHVANLYAKSRARGGGRIDQTLLLRSLADQLRHREKLGLFIAEGLLRLALLGTAVGFILMLIPIAGMDSFEVEALRGTLTGMSGGMAIALNVTVTGIGAALLLKFQYYLLDEGIADLFRIITETTEVHVISSLDRPDYALAAE